MELNTIAKQPPKKALNFKPRQKSHVRLEIEALTPGNCLEVRGIDKKKQESISVMVCHARKATKKKYDARSVGETGIDIYCLATKYKAKKPA